MALGAFVGVATGLAIIADINVPGVSSWLVSVAVAKLGFISAIGLIAAGALMKRHGRHPRVDADVERIEETLEPIEEQDVIGAPPAKGAHPRSGTRAEHPPHER